METEHLVLVGTFCLHNEVEISFIYSLHELEIVSIYTVSDEDYLSENELVHLEKMIRLHNELGINPEGLSAITRLLKQIEQLQIELKALSDRNPP